MRPGRRRQTRPRWDPARPLVGPPAEARSRCPAAARLRRSAGHPATIGISHITGQGTPHGPDRGDHSDDLNTGISALESYIAGETDEQDIAFARKIMADLAKLRAQQQDLVDKATGAGPGSQASTEGGKRELLRVLQLLQCSWEYGVRREKASCSVFVEQGEALNVIGKESGVTQ